jgi:hypothetical protein
VSPGANEYYTPSSPKSVFRKVESIQDTAIKILVNKGILEKEKCGYILVESSVTPEVEGIVEERNEQMEEVMDLLITLTENSSPLGKDSLKDRAGLMEFRYDAD